MRTCGSGLGPSYSRMEQGTSDVPGLSCASITGPVAAIGAADVFDSRLDRDVVPLTFKDVQRRRQQVHGDSTDRTPCGCPGCRHATSGHGVRVIQDAPIVALNRTTVLEVVSAIGRWHLKPRRSRLATRDVATVTSSAVVPHGRTPASVLDERLILFTRDQDRARSNAAQDAFFQSLPKENGGQRGHWARLDPTSISRR